LDDASVEGLVVDDRPDWERSKGTDGVIDIDALPTMGGRGGLPSPTSLGKGGGKGGKKGGKKGEKGGAGAGNVHSNGAAPPSPASRGSGPGGRAPPEILDTKRGSRPIKDKGGGCECVLL